MHCAIFLDLWNAFPLRERSSPVLDAGEGTSSAAPARNLLRQLLTGGF
jgi:hypothetical protein